MTILLTVIVSMMKTSWVKITRIYSYSDRQASTQRRRMPVRRGYWNLFATVSDLLCGCHLGHTVCDRHTEEILLRYNSPRYPILPLQLITILLLYRILSIITIIDSSNDFADTSLRFICFSILGILWDLADSPIRLDVKFLLL